MTILGGCIFPLKLLVTGVCGGGIEWEWWRRGAVSGRSRRRRGRAQVYEAGGGELPVGRLYILYIFVASEITLNQYIYVYFCNDMDFQN